MQPNAEFLGEARADAQSGVDFSSVSTSAKSRSGSSSMMAVFSGVCT